MRPEMQFPSIARTAKGFSVRTVRAYPPALALVASLLVVSATGGRAMAICRPGDAIWEISSRTLPDCPSLQFEPRFHVHQITHNCWRPQSLDSLAVQLASQPEMLIVFYVHGNWMPQEDARTRALAVYQRLIQCADNRPICFIAFSWPSERHEGFARDVAGKRVRLDADSYYFARAIQRLQLQRSAGYIGYSFGAAVVCGAQHLLAGGNLDRYQLGIASPIVLPAKISLMAPAFDQQELTSGGRYRFALNQNDSVINLYNSMDPILKRFRFFDRDSAPIAAGFSGLLEPRIDAPLSMDSRIEQYDCRCIGRTHAELDYLRCPHTARAMQNVLQQPSVFSDH